MRVARELGSPLGVALALTAASLFFGGGVGSSSLPWIGGAALLAAIALVAVYGFPARSWRLLPLAALVVWCAISVAWSIEPDRSWDYANRVAVYAVFALLGTYLAGRTRELAVGLATLLGAVCVWALAGKVFPWLYEDYGSISRLRGPVGYWNALALLGAIAMPLGLWLATRRRIPGALLVYGWMIAIALTYSRGGIVVAFVVAAAWLAVSGFWLLGLTTIVSAGVPAAVVIGIAFTLHGITSDNTSHATRVHDGALFGVALVVGAVVAAALARIPPPVPTRAVRRAGIAFAIVAAASVCLVAGFHADTWWKQFTAPASAEVTNSGARIGEASSNHRWVWWKEAWRGFRTHELSGTGAGSFEFTNLRYRANNLDQAIEPHDLPVQFLSETGAIGLALFLFAVLALALGARRVTDPETALALILPAYLLHSLIDIDWDVAAVSAPVFLVAGALVAEPVARRSFSFSRGLVAGGVAVAAIASLFAVWLGSRWTGDASNALATNPKQAATLARRARSVQPLSIDPLYYEALAEVEQGRSHYGAAYGLLLKATRLQPENPNAWFNLGYFNIAIRNCARLAYFDFNKATTLNPRDPASNFYYAKTLKLVNSGNAPACRG